MGMGLPLGMGIPWERDKHQVICGNGMRMGRDLGGNGNNPHSHGK